ncbi:hypothetical protein GSI_05154 [Ganoderma sinense ZZ0214-1]|uniref:Fungal-type protein kinase domain-containing protein n=1 Tax=Ganoderma sinense ZZ0214-1 TaxID=1077348 RepID=A0A2G8SFB4_9APHY|nr:hypothetical protein GSI_05154 [Ganoderma sinense ZZ0214-1]
MSGPVINSDTPFSKGRANSHHTHSLSTPGAIGGGVLKQYRAPIADDMAHAAVLADVKDFYDKYFLIPTDTVKPMPEVKDPFINIRQLEKIKGNEAVIRKEFANAATAYNLIPGMVFRECGERPAGLSVDSYRQKVDTAWYYPHDAPLPGKGTPDWGDQVIPVEFKADETGGDPYDDKKDKVSPEAKTRKEARGQMITYSELLHGIQQRTAVFMLIIIGRRVRFTRWDRSGTVVTKAFNYVDNWKFFCEILWRIGHCSRTQLGFDPTATRVYEGDADYATMKEAANMDHPNTVDHSERALENGELPEGEFKYVRQMFKDSLVSEWPWYRVKVPVEVPSQENPGAEKKTFRYFLIGKPVFRAKGMAGRGTRGYVALDCATNKFVWLKDTWRANYEFVRREGDILAALNKAQVPNIPTMLYHGDIDGQKTETPDWWERQKDASDSSESTPVSSTSGSSHTLVCSTSSKGKKRQRDEEATSDTRTDICPLRLHQHCRLVVKEVAMPLERFEFPKQLVQVMFDCVLAHWKAATLPEVPLLHRDISSGNVLIYPVVRVSKDGQASLKWRGILTDWEMSKPLEREPGQERRARQPVRTGTWQYLSIALLTPGPVYVKIPDELESFLHVLVYYALRYVKSTNCNGESIANFLDQYFDLYGHEDGMYICGDLKRGTIERGDICVGSKTYIHFNNPLDALFPQLLSWFRARYAVLTHENKLASTAAGDDAGAPSATPQQLDADVLDFLAEYGTDRESLQQAEGPSEEVKALARQIESHKAMMVELAAALAEQWPYQKTGDQIPSGWKAPVGDRFAQPLPLPGEKDENKRPRPTVVMSEPPFPSHAVPVGSPHTPQRRPVVSLAAFSPNDISP